MKLIELFDHSNKSVNFFKIDRFGNHFVIKNEIEECVSSIVYEWKDRLHFCLFPDFYTETKFIKNIENIYTSADKIHRYIKIAEIWKQTGLFETSRLECFVEFRNLLRLIEEQIDSDSALQIHNLNQKLCSAMSKTIFEEMNQ